MAADLRFIFPCSFIVIAINIKFNFRWLLLSFINCFLNFGRSLNIGQIFCSVARHLLRELCEVHDNCTDIPPEVSGSISHPEKAYSHDHKHKIFLELVIAVRILIRHLNFNIMIVDSTYSLSISFSEDSFSVHFVVLPDSHDYSAIRHVKLTVSVFHIILPPSFVS